METGEVRARAYDGEVRPVRIVWPVRWLPRYIVGEPHGEVIWGRRRAFVVAERAYMWRVERYLAARR